MTLPAHHTANGFRNNYVDSVEKSLRELLRWQWQRRAAGLPKPPQHATPVVAPDLEFLRRNASAGPEMQPAASWIGHSSILMQADGLNVLTDPVFSMRASPLSFAGPRRAQAPGILLHDLPPIDVVVISHNHYDHLDQASVLALAARSSKTVFLVPLGVKQWFERRRIEGVVELDWWQSHQVQQVEFSFTPTQHWSARSFYDRNRSLWGAWAALGPSLHWYFGGDSGYSPDFADTRRFFEARQRPAAGGGFDLALLAIGAYEPRWFMKEQHVEPSESVRMHVDLGAKKSVAIHWGTFTLTDESLDRPPVALAEALADTSLAQNADQAAPDESFITLPIGATIKLGRRAPEAV